MSKPEQLLSIVTRVEGCEKCPWKVTHPDIGSKHCHLYRWLHHDKSGEIRPSMIDGDWRPLWCPLEECDYTFGLVDGPNSEPQPEDNFAERMRSRREAGSDA